MHILCASTFLKLPTYITYYTLTIDDINEIVLLIIQLLQTFVAASQFTDAIICWCIYYRSVAS